MLSLQERIIGLENCPEFSSFSREEKVKLARVSNDFSFQKDSTVFTIDQTGEDFYIVYSGKVQIKLKANRRKIRELEKGGLFGEIAIFSKDFRLGTITCLEDCVLISFSKDKIFDTKLLPTELILKLSRILTEKIVKYLYPENNISIKNLIKCGENETIEFKSSLNQHNKWEIAETITAFMNLNGGTILVGVTDDGIPKGLNLTSDIKNQKSKRDECTRNILDAIKTRINSEFLDLIDFDWEKVNDNMIMRIDCTAAESPVIYKDFSQNHEKEYYIVRTNSENLKLERTSEIVPHIIKKFRS